MAIDYEDIKLSNCASCSATLLAKSLGGIVKHLDLKARRKLPPLCFGYIQRRPYCRGCFNQIKDAQKAAS